MRPGSNKRQRFECHGLKYHDIIKNVVLKLGKSNLR